MKRILPNQWQSCWANEKGVSKEAMQYSNGNVLIPIHGMAESPQCICGLFVDRFEAMRQRMVAGMYDLSLIWNHELQASAWQEYLQQARPRMYESNPSFCLIHWSTNSWRKNRLIDSASFQTYSVLN